MANSHLTRHLELHSEAFSILREIDRLQRERKLNTAMANNPARLNFWNHRTDLYQQEDARLARELRSLYGKYATVMATIVAECDLEEEPAPPATISSNRLIPATA